MDRRWMKAYAIPALLLAVALSSCDAGNDLLAPESAEGVEAARVARNGDHHRKRGGEHRFIKRGRRWNSDATATEILGPEGGTLTLEGGHSLHVPAGAVKRPTLFQMRLVDEEYVIVDLAAYELRGRGWGRGGRFHGARAGRPVERFHKPVVLTLSYAGSEVEPEELAVAWLVNNRRDGPLLPVESVVNEDDQTVSAYLKHFSRFALVSRYALAD